MIFCDAWLVGSFANFPAWHGKPHAILISIRRQNAQLLFSWPLLLANWYRCCVTSGLLLAGVLVLIIPGLTLVASNRQHLGWRLIGCPVQTDELGHL